MTFEKTYNYWLRRVADLPVKTKRLYGRQVHASKHRTYPAMMLRKLKRLKVGGVE